MAQRDGIPVRLQKLVAGAGIASRRAAERLILDGRVSVNGRVVRTLGTCAVPGVDDVRVDGVALAAPVQRTYLLLHKPPGYTATTRDPHAERTVIDLLPHGSARLFPVGRLDRESEGLLLLTDDGDLAERLLHPRYGLDREYAVLVRGTVTTQALARLRQGASVEGAHVTPRAVHERPPPPGAGDTPATAWLSVTLAEGRKREVRVLCAAAGLQVLRLIRVRFGPLRLGDLPAGHTRPLTADELNALQRSARSTTGTNPAADRGTSGGER